MEQQYVVFALEKENYAISISNVQEIIRFNQPTSLPNTPAYMEGIINVRGDIVSIINLKKFFSLNETHVDGKEDDKRIIILDVDGNKVGILVDLVSEVIKVSDENVEQAQPVLGIENKYIQGIAKENSRLIILLNTDVIFEAKKELV